ncbi:MAG: glycosyltransferase family 25 protein [Rhodomicrobium sp.]
MLTYVINLDRQPARMERMAQQLGGVAFERVPAVEGRGLEGLERRAGEVPRRPEELTRYERAVGLSHREVWQRLIESGASHCCVLEDDVILSPEFPAFVGARDWLPANAGIVKIEALGRRKILLGRQKYACKGRVLQALLSSHLGTGAYIVSREAAAMLLERTRVFCRPLDHIMFEDLLCENLCKIYQMVPALCIQERKAQGASALSSELQSTVQSGKRKSRLSGRQRALRELRRPFVSLVNTAAYVLSGRIATAAFKNVQYL